MGDKTTGLWVDWCDHRAAKYAVEHWHYSKKMPSGKLVKIGAWEDEQFIGVVLYGMGATPLLSAPFGLKQFDVAELVRIALNKHRSPVSQIVAQSIRMIRRNSPKLKLLISYADPDEGHTGKIYQAGNWTYIGRTNEYGFTIDTRTGKKIHPRSITVRGEGYMTQLREQGLVKWVKVWKHKYVMPLCREAKTIVEPMRKPHPKSDEITNS